MKLQCTVDLIRALFTGANGCGKSNLLSALSAREIPVPEHIDIFHVKREMPPSAKTGMYQYCYQMCCVIARTK